MIAKNLTFLVLVTTLFGITACKKDRIAPFRQEVAFIKYYGHVEQQIASDVQQTPDDNGYILVGSSNSYRPEAFHDVYVVKTDSLGNELWSRRLGSSGFEDYGIKVLVLQDGSGYLVAATSQDQTPIPRPGGGRSLPPRKIILYRLDLTGQVQQTITLRANLANTNDSVKDIKQLPDGGFVLTGSTDGVNVLKPEYQANRDNDLLDILTMRLNANFGVVWQTVDGFVGEDEGVAIHQVGPNFVITGLTQQKVGNDFEERFFLVKYRASAGTIVNQETFAPPGVVLSTASATLMADTTRIILYGQIDRGLRAGSLAMLQVDVKEGDLLQVGDFFYLNRSDLRQTTPLASQLKANSIAHVPGTNHYLFTATDQDGSGQSIQIVAGQVQVNTQNIFSLNWANNFGGPRSLNTSASTIIPVIRRVEGVAQVNVLGFVFTGTFDLITNTMIGLVRLNNQGTLRPE